MLELGRNMRVHEVRILPPIPTGRLLDAGDDVLLSEEERRQIIQTDKQVNGWLGYPKMSSSVRSESVELFGCGAGSQHSYIDAAGNVYPCDFVPLSFGNVAQRSFRDIWCEVATTMGGTRNQCFMHENVEAVRQAANGQLPLPPEVSHRICRDAKRADSPDFFRQWGQMWQ
jgi:MoaA/NifB/PqqE/SkfB family radical SAM enzyme